MKYWVYMNGQVPGSYAPGELAALPGFTNTTLVCPAEGEILEKNWRRSGEFDELIRAMAERDAKMPPADRRKPDAAAAAAGDVNQLLDQTSARLFTHVSSLMKELDSRREERALTQSLQRQLVDLNEQLDAARVRQAELEGQLARTGELEEAARRGALQIEKLESSLKAREDGMSELRIQVEKTRTELENSKRRLGEALNDLAIRNRLVDKLSRDLTDKELSLAKSLAVIRRLEEDLNRLCPPSETAPQAPAAEESTPAEAVASADAAPVEEPAALQPMAPEAAPLPEAPSPAAHADTETPAAHGALVEKFRNLFGKLDH